MAKQHMLLVVFAFLLPIALSLLISAYFSAAETAITGASPAVIHQLAQEGNTRARLVQKLQADKDMLISSVLIGNIAANIFSSAAATALFLQVLGDEGMLVSTVVMTILVLIFAEITPKSYALLSTEDLALKLAPSLTSLLKLLLPITKTFRFIAHGLIRLLRRNSTEIKVSAYDSLRGAIDLHHHEGHMVKSDKDMLGSILDLKEIMVEHIMVHRTKMVTVNVDLPAQDIIQQVLSASFTRIPIWQGNPDNIVAILHVRDLLKLLNQNEQITTEQILSVAMQPWFISEHTLVGEQLRQFQARRSHLALVVGEFGDLKGLVTLEDILEEIVGSIEDEHDPINTQITEQADGAVLIEGVASIRDINRKLDWDLPDENAASVAGLILNHTKDLPEAGSEVVIAGVKFTIIRRSPSRILMVRAELLPQEVEG